MIVSPSFRKGFGIGVIQRRMCGIALIVSGIRIDLSSLDLEYAPPSPVVDQVVFSVDDLKEALWRRGPDSLGTEKVFLQSKVSISGGEEQILSITRGLEETNGDDSCLQCIRNKLEGMYFSNRETPKLANSVTRPKCVPELHFFGAALQLRGINPINQPLVDEYGNILVYNGEIFGGVPIGFSCNDSEFLMQSLGKSCSCNSLEQTTACDCNLGGKSSVPELLSAIKGPWAVVYWQNSSKTLWFGRDAFGRRSLLVHWPTLEDSRLLLSSVSPRSSLNKDIEFEADSNIGNLTLWEELPCGVYSIQVASSKLDGCLTGEVRKHEWTSSMIKELIKWERTSVEPKLEDLQLSRIKLSGAALASDSLLAQRVLTALRESVMRRSTQNANFQAVPHEAQLEARVPVAILFSGGLDSMIIAALLDGCLEPCYGIDLLNVSFDGEFAPDRISAKAGIRELRRIAPLRRWKLVEIDADLSMLALETKHVTSLITPAKTYMDLNIGVALWLAAGGDGWVAEGFNNNVDEVHWRVKYKSESRILLVGSGADEQCAGYGRHKTKYRQGGWKALHEEMRLDMQRIWKRNLGRDDRCISDNGKEARFPFLDEDVIRTLLDIPLWNIADLDQPSGRGDKKILREVAQMLGIYEAATLPKRAIQFSVRP